MKQKKLEIKSLSIGSLFKTICYLMVIPIAIYVIIGLFFVLAGIISGKAGAAAVGIFLIIFFPIVLIGLNGGLGALAGLIYNILTTRFGGLEITIVESDINSPSNPIITENKTPIYDPQFQNPMMSNLYQKPQQQIPPKIDNSNQ